MSADVLVLQPARRVVRLDLARATSKAALLEACGAAFHLAPEWGRNWDALADALGDLASVDAAHGWLVLIDSAAALAAAEPASWNTFCDILREAASTWRQRGRPLTVIINGNASAPSG